MAAVKKEILNPELKNLPADLWFKIIVDFLGLPEHRVLSVLAKKFKGLATNNSVWKKRFEIHFPHRFAELEKKQNVDWYAEFIRATAEEYKDLSKAIQLLMFAIKEGKTQYLNLDGPVVLTNLLYAKDATKTTPIDWLLWNENQPMLDIIFKFVLEGFKRLKLDPLIRKNLFEFVVEGFKRLEEEPSIKLRNDLQMHTGWAAAHWAVVTNQPEHVLSEHIGEQNFADSAMTPFHVAATFGLLDALKFLQTKFQVDHRTALANKKGIKKHRTALHLAARQGHLDCVTFLIEKEADCSATVHKTEYQTVFDTGINALHYAAQKNHTDVAEFLVKKISPVKLRNDYKTPLFFTIRNKNKPLFDTFLGEIKASKTSVECKRTLNVLLHAAVKSDNNYFIPPILELGADPAYLDVFVNKSALDIAFDRNNRDAMAILVGKTPVEQINYKPPTPTSKAVVAIGIGATLLLLLSLLLYDQFFDNGSDGRRVAFILCSIGLLIIGILGGSFLVYRKIENNRTEMAFDFMREAVGDELPAKALQIKGDDGIEYHPLPQAPSSFNEQYNAVGFFADDQKRDIEKGEQGQSPYDDYEMKRTSLKEQKSYQL